ncbi:MAG: hypothetical protein CBE26_00495, partial [Kiritimatiellaceae bacterium TMED266]
MEAPTWITTYPKIGIRPTIDGRYGGVRESLEDQVIQMAEAAADLIRNSLHYPDGKPVEVILADSCIGGGGQGAAFGRKNVLRQ